MEAEKYSEKAFFKFLDYLAEKHLVNKMTVRNRRNTAIQVLGILVEAEKKDLRDLDIEQLFVRFENKNPHKYKPESLSVYKSRFRAAMDDFLTWAESPSSFKPSSPTRKRVQKSAQKKEKSIEAKTVAATAPDDKAQYAQEAQEVIVPVPIRPGLILKLVNVPSDLKESEAKKVAAVIMALASDG